MKKDEGFEVTASDKIVHKETYDTLETPCVQPVRAYSTVHGFTAAVS